MKVLFLIVLFGETVVLTPEPIDIVGEVTFRLPEPVSAVTSGAHVRIDVTRSLPNNVDTSNVIAVLDYLEERFPDGSVAATLTTESGQKTILDRVSGSTGGEGAEVTVWTSSGVDTDVDFSELKIETTTRLENVTVLWQNYAK